MPQQTLNSIKIKVSSEGSHMSSIIVSGLLVINIQRERERHTHFHFE